MTFSGSISGKDFHVPEKKLIFNDVRKNTFLPLTFFSFHYLWLPTQGLIPMSGRSPGEGNDNPLQYSCLKNPMDRGFWWAIVHGVAIVGHNLATKPPPPCVCMCVYIYTIYILYILVGCIYCSSLVGYSPGVTKSQTQMKWFSAHTHILYIFPGLNVFTKQSIIE